MNEVYITNGLRTFIGAKNKVYKNIPAESLAAEIIRKLNEKNEAEQMPVELVISGNATGGGGNISRLSLLKAGLGDEVCGITMDSQCSSGMESIISAFSRIKCGLNTTVIAGGTESASTRCSRSYNPNHPNFDSSKQDNSYSSAQFIPEDFSENSMILGADETCRKYQILPQDMMASAIKSHQNAQKARINGDLEQIILPAFGADKDELIRPSVSENFISRLKPVLKDGIINAATSCLFSDGAAYLTLSSQKKNFFKDSSSCFRIVQAADCGGNRFLSPESLIKNIEKLLHKSQKDISQIDRIDYNQAFACIDNLYSRNFSLPSNEFGGALAYGHPYGASGAIILLHLICALEKFNEHFGIAVIPAAGGISSGVLIERCT